MPRVSTALLTLLLPFLSARVHAQVPPNGPYVIAGFSVEGNRSTLPHVILRELVLREGDTVATSDQLYYLLERSRQNVWNMGLFNSVRVLPTYLGGPEVFVTVTVTERWFYWPTPIFKYSDPNFNTWWLTRDLSRTCYGAFLYRYNMRHRNETLYAKVQLGYTRELALRYRFPYIDRRMRWGLAFGAGNARQEELTLGTRGNKREFITLRGRDTRTEWRGDLEFTLRPGHDQRHAFRFGYAATTVLDTVRRAYPNYLPGGSASSTFLSAGYTFTWDRRDSRVFPLGGDQWIVRLDRHGLGFGGRNAPDVTTFYAGYMRSWRPAPRWSVGGSLRAKATMAGELPYYIQQGLGYDDYVRGYEYYVIDGEHYVLGKLNALWALVTPREYVFAGMKSDNFRTLYLAVYLNAFVDLGYVRDTRYEAANFLANTWQKAAGMGVNVVTSYDQVMRVEYTLNAEFERAFYLHFTHPF
jgi:outer membrane protein assembly factor BamA